MYSHFDLWLMNKKRSMPTYLLLGTLIIVGVSGIIFSQEGVSLQNLLDQTEPKVSKTLTDIGEKVISTFHQNSELVNKDQFTIIKDPVTEYI
jgi:hypothetical protein